MKKLISLMLIFVLLGVGIGAGWEFDNVKEFTPNDKYGTIEITNAFGLGDTLAEYTLLENTDVCAVNCYALGTTTLFNGGVLFSDLNFKDIQQKQDREVLSSQIYLIKTRKVSYSVPEYTTQCNKEEVNGSFSDCESVQTGSHLVSYNEKYKEKYNGEELEAGVYEWKVEGKKNIHSSVDWVATSMGIELNEWADWISGSVGRVLFNITNNVGSEINISYNNEFNLSGFTYSNIVVTNEAGTVEYPLINITNIINKTAELYIDLPELPTGLTNFYIYEMTAAQTAFNFEDMESKMFADTGSNRAVGGAVTDNGWTYVSGSNEWTYSDDYNHFSNLSLKFDSGVERRITHPIEFNSQPVNFSYEMWFYYTGTTPAEHWIVFETTSYHRFIGFVTSISATNVTYNTGADIITNVSIGGVGWHRFTSTMDAAGTLKGYWDGAELYTVVSWITPDKIWYNLNDGADTSYIDDLFMTRWYGTDLVLSSGDYEIVPPVAFISETNFTNTTAFFDTELNCSTNYTGADGGYVNFTYFRNDTVVTTYDTQRLNVNNGTVVYTDTLVTETLVRGDTWICRVNAYDGTEHLSENSTALIISNTVPTTPIQQYPLNDTFNTTTSIEFKCNGSEHGDTHPTYYEFWGNFTEPLVILQNLTAETYTLTPWQNGTFSWACRSHDNISSSNFTTNFTLNIQTGNIQSLQESHTATISSGSSQTFKLNVTYNNLNIDNVTSTMYYNNTVRTVTTTTFNSTKTKFSTTFTVPLVPTKVNNSFYWNVTANYLNGSTKLFSYNYTQAINALTVYNCSANNFSNLVLNLSLKNETTKLLIDTGTIQGYFTIWNTDPAVNTTSYIDVSGNETYLCISDNTSNFQANAEIHYRHANSYLRIHYLLNTTLNVSNKQTVDLHTLAEDDSNNIQFNLLDNLEKPIEFNYINVERFYPETNTYTLVAMGRSDDVGQDLIPLRMNDVYYKFTVKSYPNTIRLVSTPRKVTTTTLYFYISESSVPQILDSYNNVVYGLTYNNVTNTFRLEFTTDGTVQEMCMKVTKWRNIDSVQLCDQCLSSSSGTITCPTGNATGAYLATAYMNINPSPLLDSLEYVVWGVDNFFDKYGLKDSALLAFFLVAVLSMVMIFSPSAAIVMALLGLITSIMLGLFKIGMGTATVVVIAGIAILYKLRS